MKILSKEELEDHKETALLLDTIKNEVFTLVKKKILSKEKITELDVQKFILEQFKKNSLTSEKDKPIVAINEHAATPHYSLTIESNVLMKKGDLLLIDLWARKKEGIYADITWMGYIGKEIPEEHKKKFSLIVFARDKTLQFLQKEIDKGNYPTGSEVDDVCRAVIVNAGYGSHFVHNTGHSIDEKVHGDSTNLRTLKKREERRMYKGLLFSIEPGIYFPGKFGYRTEIDVYINSEGKVIVTGPKQKEILCLLKES